MSFYTTAPTAILDLIHEFAEWGDVLDEMINVVWNAIDNLDSELLVARCTGFMCFQAWSMARIDFIRLTIKWDMGPRQHLEEILQEEISYALDCATHHLV